MSFINKSELKFIFIASIFSFIFFVLIIPNITNHLTQISPLVQFIVFNVAIFIFLQIFLKSVASDSKVNWGYSFGLIILFIALEVIVPPLSISINGEFAKDVTLIQSSTDYNIGLFWSNLGISNFALYLFTYLVTPIILLVIASLLLKNFVKEL